MLRKNNAALKAGDVNVVTYRLHTDANHFIFAFLRRNKQTNNEVLVVINLSEHVKHLVHIHDGELSGSFNNVFTHSVKDFTEEKHFALQPWEYQVWAR